MIEGNRAEGVSTQSLVRPDRLAAIEADLLGAQQRNDWPAVKQAVGELLDHSAPTAPLLLTLARALWHLRDLAAADRAAEDALSLDPTLAEAVVVRAWVAAARGDGETALVCYRRLTELNPGTVRWWLKWVQLLNWHGHVDEAVTQLATVRRQWPTDPTVRAFIRSFAPAARLTRAATADRPRRPQDEYPEDPELQTLVNRAPPEACRLRPLLIDDPNRDVLIVAAPGADTGVLVFTGSNDSLSMPLEVFDRYLAALPVTAVYLKDFRRLRFLFGIQSLSDSYAGTLEAFRDMLRSLGVRRLCTLGNCDGGFAAIRYGVELGAERIIGFKARTSNEEETTASFEQGHSFKRRHLAAHVGSEMCDLRSFLETRPHRARIDLFYGQNDPKDGVHAQRLAAFPGVSLRPQPGIGNALLLRNVAMADGDFCRTLAEMLQVAAPP